MPENHGWTHANDIDPIPPSPVTFHIELSGHDPGVDDPAYIVNGRVYVGIPSELDGWYVVKFWGYQSYPGALGTDTEIQLTRTSETSFPIDQITSTNVIIPDNGFYPSTQAVIDTAKNQVTAEDTMLRVDVADVDGAFGLACEITLSPVNVPL